MDEHPATTGLRDHAWQLRWHKREALLRNLIARWRTPAIERRVIPLASVESLRAQFADEL